MADVQIAVIDTIENEVNVAVPGVQGPIGLTGSVAIAQDGTVTEPGIRFENDTNTGIYRPGADQLAISTNAVERVEFGTSEVVFNDGGTNYDFRIEGDTNANLLFVDASTDRVGIGTTSPVNLLHVQGTIETRSSGEGLAVHNTSEYIGFIGNNSGNFYINAGGTNDVLELQTNGTERARLDSSGRLLVGPAASSIPTFGIDAGLQLHNLANTNGAQLSIIKFNNDTSAGSLILGKSKSGTVSPGTALVGNDNLGNIVFVGDDGTDLGSSGASITAFVDGTPGTNDMPGRLVFSTTADGAASPTERMRIDSAGTTTLTSAAATSPFIAKISTSEVARIDSSGRLLVGTSTSIVEQFGGQAKLQAVTTGSYAISAFNYSSDANPCVLTLGKSRSASAGSHTIVQSGDNVGVLRYEGSDGTGFITAAQITGQVDGTPGTNDMPGRLVFSTTADGAASTTERLRITSAGVLQVADAGNIQVGTTTGTKIGTATTQKIGFFDKTPVVQPTAVADATDAATVITQLNALLTRMRNLGLIAT